MARRKVVVGVVVLVIAIALLVDRLLVSRHDYYSRLLMEHECYPLPCQVDVNDDGVSGEIVLQEPDLHRSAKSWLVISDAGRELLRMPYDHTDRTFRTHVAVLEEAEGTRIVIYDGSGGPDKRINAVYGWSGQGLARVAPSRSDSLILSAMSAYDDTGTFNDWVLYKIIRLPLLAVLLLGAAITVFLLYRRPAAR